MQALTDCPSRVLISVPNHGSVHPETTLAISKIVEKHLLDSKIGIAVDFPNGAPLEMNRHRAVERFLKSESNYTHLLFLDSDMIPQPETVERLLGLQAPIACAPCPILAWNPSFHDWPIITTNIWQKIPAGSFLQEPGFESMQDFVQYIDPDFFPHQPFYCHGTGLACCLIDRKIFESFKKPWFRFEYSDVYSTVKVGEDAFFFNQCLENGIQPMVDPGLLCDHIKTIDVTHWQNYFLDQKMQWDWNSTADSPKETTSIKGNILLFHQGSNSHSKTNEFVNRAIETGNWKLEISQQYSAQSCIEQLVTSIQKNHESDWFFVLNSSVNPHPEFLDFASIASQKDYLMIQGWIPPMLDELTINTDLPDNLDQVNACKQIQLNCELYHKNCLPILQGVLHNSNDKTTDATLLNAVREGLAINAVTLPIGCEHFREIRLNQLLAIKKQLRNRFPNQSDQ